MFCLRSWLPLLFIPTNASPTFIFLFFVCTYFLNRPCVYCSFLLLILFLTSCNWSDQCFFDFGSNWFEPRAVPVVATRGEMAGGCTSCHHSGHGSASPGSAAPFNGTVPVPNELYDTVTMAAELLNSTVSTVAGSTIKQLSRTKAEWTGIGMEWLRSLLGRREWRIDCLDVNIRL
ncbi:hypothetical protein SEUCBS139899_001411 [Sporothrix eucalyptigena]|uniref:Bladder cancer-related BC10-like protein n=1 Tax=Sporothrix eucalyptigena TaxID=1812306 RepID=A0ABP0B8E9_9PEZI